MRTKTLLLRCLVLAAVGAGIYAWQTGMKPPAEVDQGIKFLREFDAPDPNRPKPQNPEQAALIARARDTIQNLDFAKVQKLGPEVKRRYEEEYLVGIEEMRDGAKGDLAKFLSGAGKIAAFKEWCAKQGEQVMKRPASP